MPALLAQKDSAYVLNHCTRYLARDNTDARDNYGQYETSDPRFRINAYFLWALWKTMKQRTPTRKAHSGRSGSTLGRGRSCTAAPKASLTWHLTEVEKNLVRDATEGADLLEILSRRGYEAEAITADYQAASGCAITGSPDPREFEPEESQPG